MTTDTVIETAPTLGAQRRTRLKTRVGTSALLLPTLVLVAALIVAPAVLLITYAFRSSSFAGAGPGPTLEQFRSLIHSGSFIRLALRTLSLGLLVATIVTALAFVMAYGIRFRFKPRTGMALLAIALVAGIASFLVRIYAWGTLLSTNGVINGVLVRLGLTSHPLGFLFLSYFAVLVTMVYLYLPIAIVVLYGGLQDVDPYALEAAQDLGAGRWRSVAEITLPQVRNSMVSAFLFVAVLASADYVTPSLVGGTRGQMVGVLISSEALDTLNLPTAAAMAVAFLVMLAVALLVVLAAFRLLRFGLHRSAGALSRVGRATGRWTPSWVGRQSFSRIGTCLLIAYLIVPTLVVLVFSFNSAATVGLPLRGLTTSWYQWVFQQPGFDGALQTSLELMAIAVVGASVVGSMFAFAAHRLSGWRQRALLGVALLPFALPGILIGLGLTVIADSLRLPLGFAPTAAAHVVLLTPVVVLVVSARLKLMNPELPQAARDLGASSWRAFRTVTLRLVAPSLGAAALVVAAYSLDEIFVTTFTIGTGSTLPLWIFSRARVGFTPGLNALGVMLAGATTALAVVGLLISRQLSAGPQARTV